MYILKHHAIIQDLIVKVEEMFIFQKIKQNFGIIVWINMPDYYYLKKMVIK